MALADPAPGFTDPVHDAQGAFRALLDALARPGTRQPLAGITGAPEPLGPQAAAILLTLADYATPLWFSHGIDCEAVRAFTAFHTGAPIAGRAGAASYLFIAGESELPDLADLAIGEDEYPDRSATLVIKVAGFSGERTLSGPGIDGTAVFGAAGLGDRFWSLARANAALFPLGVDFVLAGPGEIAALPRSTRVEG